MTDKTKPADWVEDLAKKASSDVWPDDNPLYTLIWDKRFKALIIKAITSISLEELNKVAVSAGKELEKNENYDEEDRAEFKATKPEAYKLTESDLKSAAEYMIDVTEESFNY